MDFDLFLKQPLIHPNMDQPDHMFIFVIFYFFVNPSFNKKSKKQTYKLENKIVTKSMP